MWAGRAPGQPVSLLDRMPADAPMTCVPLESDAGTDLGPSPPAQGGGIVYLVNSTKNGQWTSGFANYNTAGGNDGHQPDQYIDINKSSSVTWEGGRFSGTWCSLQPLGRVGESR